MIFAQRVLPWFSLWAIHIGAPINLKEFLQLCLLPWSNMSNPIDPMGKGRPCRSMVHLLVPTHGQALLTGP